MRINTKKNPVFKKNSYHSHALRLTFKVHCAVVHGTFRVVRPAPPSNYRMVSSPQKKPCPHEQSVPIPPDAHIPGNHKSTFYPWGFASPGYFTQMDAYSMRPFVPGFLYSAY